MEVKVEDKSLTLDIRNYECQNDLKVKLSNFGHSTVECQSDKNDEGQTVSCSNLNEKCHNELQAV